MLLILEDANDRTQRFAAALGTLDPAPPFRNWRCAHAMIREAAPLLPSAALISLDHDLLSEPGQPDPGDGYQVAQWLATQPPSCPVIIHSSNTERSAWMAGELQQAGWRYGLIAPFGERWIETDWLRTVLIFVPPRYTDP